MARLSYACLFGEETARQLEPLKFCALLEQIEPHAQGGWRHRLSSPWLSMVYTASIPLAIKKDIMTLITQFLERQFEA